MPSPARGEHSLDELEGQRGLAAVLVVVFHAYQYDRSGPTSAFPYEGSPQHALLVGLDGAVSWFFVLSAFLLARPYVRAVLAGRPATPARTFLARRAVRILPLYVVAVTVVWAWRNPGLPGDWRDLLLHLTFTHNLSSERIFSTIGPAWSLAVEVQFYVLLAVLGGLAARCSTRLATRRARLALLWTGTAALAAVSIAWCAAAALWLEQPATAYATWFSLPAKLGIFATGIAVAVWTVSRPSRLGAAPARALRVGALLLLAAAAGLRQGGGGADAVFHGVCGLAFGLLVLAAVAGPPSGAWQRVVGGRALVWCGTVSYSLYLWHEPLLHALAGLGLVPDPSPGAFPVTAVVLVAAGLAVAWVSWCLVEHPASQLRSRVDGPRHGSAPIVHRTAA